MIQVTPEIILDENEIQESFVRSPGPGGQNVNKVSTAVQIRFDAAHSACLPEEVRRRLAAHKPKTRRPTRPTRASQARRLESKRRRSLTKRQRRSPGDME